MKMTTIRFYTNDLKYMGWQYVTNTTLSEVVNWLRSGNYIKHKNEIFNPFSSTSSLRHINGKRLKKILTDYKNFKTKEVK